MDLLAVLVLMIVIAVLIAWATKRDRQCPMCSGLGQRQVDGKLVKCVICSGKGKLN